MRCTESSSFLPKGSSMLAPFLPHRLSLPTFWPFSLSSYIHRLEFSGCLPSRLNMLPQLFKWLLARWILKSTHFKCEPVCSTCTVQFTNTCLKAQASTSFIKIVLEGDGKLAPKWRILPALQEDLGLIPNTINHFNPRGPDILLGPPQAPGTHGHGQTCRQNSHTQKIINNMIINT